MKRQWKVRRQFQPTTNAERRWDRAYQHLLEWTLPIDPVPDQLASFRPPLGRRRMHTMPIRVVADRVFRQCRDDVGPPTLLQHSRFLPDHFESRADILGCQILRDPERGIVRRRLDVVFGIEPQDHIYTRDAADYPASCEGRCRASASALIPISPLANASHDPTEAARTRYACPSAPRPVTLLPLCSVSTFVDETLHVLPVDQRRASIDEDGHW